MPFSFPECAHMHKFRTLRRINGAFHHKCVQLIVSIVTSQIVFPRPKSTNKQMKGGDPVEVLKEISVTSLGRCVMSSAQQKYVESSSFSSSKNAAISSSIFTVYRTGNVISERLFIMLWLVQLCILFLPFSF